MRAETATACPEGYESKADPQWRKWNPRSPSPLSDEVLSIQIPGRVRPNRKMSPELIAAPNRTLTLHRNTTDSGLDNGRATKLRIPSNRTIRTGSNKANLTA